ncbi:SPOR domain-containing protein [Sulfitobacter sp. D35]|uniref:SPOR domain-containing protein n=1 Tax=Sulfitobacter sp. D35 TaxID=3083252 RepID=UPI00296F23E4|nr:SPOR domain-containing protein [Sulfitobacter sp. D35]MDW4498723.1 SPOR domain-containing protein [Sulfitobacter sp. D35]
MTYSGKQYVDSAGCAFTRGGIDDVVVWVPRRGRDRQPLCGLEPTFATRAVTPVSAPIEATTNAPVNTVAPAPRRTAARAQPARVAPAQPVARTREAGPTVVTGRTRVVPKHVWQNRQNTQNVAVPHGYRTVWEDDRLNPHRAVQTLDGMAATRLVWTNTVPRRLVDVDTGHDMTAKVALVYPYTDLETQRRDLGTVTLSYREGQVVKKVRPNSGRVTYSSRSAPRQNVSKHFKVRPAPTPPGRYVQVAVFKQKDTAMATARQVQRLGLPVRLKIGERQGRRFFTLVAGPFVRDQELHSALGTVQKAGFEDAFLRN